MHDEAWVYARANGGRVWHIVRYALPPEGEVRSARCGLVPSRGWARLYSSLDRSWPRCRRCAERE
jgi:hypothetical protein